jgi:hypothetical protein
LPQLKFTVRSVRVCAGPGQRDPGEVVTGDAVGGLEQVVSTRSYFRSSTNGMLPRFPRDAVVGPVVDQLHAFDPVPGPVIGCA